MIRKFRKAIMLIAVTIMVSGSLTGCLEYESEQLSEDTTTDRIAVDEETGKLETKQELDVEGEPFKLVCEYDTGKYDINNWHVTDDKSVNMRVTTKGLPEGYEVYIEHMHADIILKSTSLQINGITQDSMDDYSHAEPSNGFYIDDEIPYYNIFSIDGYTSEFYQLWGYCFGNYGSISSSYQRLTETNIIKVGTYAEKLHIVYDLSITRPDSEHFYNVSVESEILIPVSQDPGTEKVTVSLTENDISEDNANE
jgi:hypothetical protein